MTTPTAAVTTPTAVVTSPTASPTPSSLIAGPRPRPRWVLGFAYDEARRESVLFGGLGTSPLYDTWIWSGAGWAERHPAQSPHAFLALGYDAKRQQIVGFGGTMDFESLQGSLPPGDTWIWDGQTWSQAHPVTNPPVRSNPTLTWDSRRDRLIMLGGTARANESLFDKWAWDGTDWHRLADGLTGSVGQDAAYFPKNDTLVECCQNNYGTTDPGQLMMFLYDGTTWTQRTTGTTALSFGGAMTYDEQLGKVVMFGVPNPPIRRYDEIYVETWAWNGSSWSRIETGIGPKGLYYPSIAYDAARQRVVVFGGYRLLNAVAIEQNALWEFDGRNWTEIQASEAEHP